MFKPLFVHNTVVATESQHGGGVGVCWRGPEREETGRVVVGDELRRSGPTKVHRLVLDQGLVLTLRYIAFHPVREEVPGVAMVIVDTGPIQHFQTVSWVLHWGGLETEQKMSGLASV